GKQTILGIALIVGGYFGWQAWTDHNVEQASAASLTYQEMLDNLVGLAPGETLAEEKQLAVGLLADKLKADYSDTQYAVYAALTKAKLAVEANNLDDAAVELQWAMDNADEVSESIARLRLARVQAARGDLDAALQLVQGVDAGEMKSAFEEAKGDFYLEQGNTAAAYSAYQSAAATDNSGDASVRALLQLKIGLVQPAPLEEPAAEE
ncbi:MAG: tetratricopeptide repeat protein, partial [Porticoccaceae bacterium]|nr:tetratricopeptide repeat protein [Porticoccaceae bacterium]